LWGRKFEFPEKLVLSRKFCLENTVFKKEGVYTLKKSVSSKNIFEIYF